jgi:uncharacterized protein
MSAAPDSQHPSAELDKDATAQAPESVVPALPHEPRYVSGVPQFFKRLLWSGVRIYGLLLIAVYALQGNLLYIKTPEPLADTQANAQAASMRLWPTPQAYTALLAEPKLDPAAPQAIRGTVIVFHGNAGTAGQRAHYAQFFGRCALRTLLVEYPGYGARPAGELRQAALAREGAQIILAAKAQFSAQREAPLYVLGESLGAGVAAQAIARAESHTPNTVQAAVLVTPWDSLASPAQARFWFLPVRLLLKDSYDSVAALQNYRQRLIVVRASADELIPAHATARLFAQFSGPKRLIEVPGGHVSWLENTDAAWWQGLCNDLSGAQPVQGAR